MRNILKKLQENRRIRKVRKQAAPYLGHRTFSDSLEREFIRAYFRW